MRYENLRLRWPLSREKRLASLGILGLIGILSINGFAQAQGPQGGFSQGGGEVVSFDALKSRLQATDEEWKVIGPEACAS